MSRFTGFLYLLGMMVLPGPGEGTREVLVILENSGIQETHSLFLNQFTEMGFNTVIKIAEDPTLSLKKYGEYLYQDIVILAPTVEELGGGLTADSIVEFIDDGGNVMIAAGPETGNLIRDLAAEVGMELDEDGTSVIDHLNFDPRDEGNHDLIVSEHANLIRSEKIVGKTTNPLLYRGLAMVTDPANPLVLSILSGSSSSYSHNPLEEIKDYPHAVGKSTVLLGGLQARNNARIVVSGSMEFFSDLFYTSKVGSAGKPAGNQELSSALISWCFQQTGVIRIDSVSHKLVGESSSPAFYTIRENCEFSIKMSEYVNGVWVPYKADDVQMEFVRIDPFVRQRMINKNGQLTAKFKIPDVYGVFKFKVDYSRLGLTGVSTVTQVSVHPLQHNQYERFIVSAYPYYASAFSMMAGVFIFSFAFLHIKEETKSKNE
jgi:oligosaccharyltransferase complex subunit beta